MGVLTLHKLVKEISNYNVQAPSSAQYCIFQVGCPWLLEIRSTPHKAKHFSWNVLVSLNKLMTQPFPKAMDNQDKHH